MNPNPYLLDEALADEGLDFDTWRVPRGAPAEDVVDRMFGTPPRAHEDEGTAMDRVDSGV